MSYKILEQNGVDNENVDGAAFNDFCAGRRDGIIKGVLNECAVIKISSNTVAISTGEMLICGVRVKFNELYTVSLSSVPASPVEYQIIADLVLDASRKITFKIILRQISETLIQDKLYKTESGHYQAEIARFTHSPENDIVDLVQTMYTIVGGSGSEVYIGNVETFQVGPNVSASVEVSKRYDPAQERVVTDYKFNIPQGKKGDNLYTFSVQNGKLLVTSAIADENAMSLKNGHLVLG